MDARQPTRPVEHGSPRLASLDVDTHDVISQHPGIEEEILLFGHVVAEQSNQIEQT